MSEYYVDPAATGSNNGSNWDNAWTSIQSAFDTAIAGDIVYCRGTETVSAQLDIDTNSGNVVSGWIKFIGCNSGGGRDGTRFTIQGDGANTCDLLLVTGTGTRNLYWFENFDFADAYGGTSRGFHSGSNANYGWVFINCCWKNCAGSGLSAYYLNNSLFWRCSAYGNGDYGAIIHSNAKWFFGSIHDNTGDGTYAGEFVGSAIYDNGGDGAGNVLTWGLFLNCVINGNTGSGIVSNQSQASPPFIAVGTRITNHSLGYGIDCGGDQALAAFCYFEDNNDNIGNDTIFGFMPNPDGTTTNIEDQADSNEGYVSKTDGSENFNLRPDATLRRFGIDVSLS